MATLLCRKRISNAIRSISNIYGSNHSNALCRTLFSKFKIPLCSRLSSNCRTSKLKQFFGDLFLLSLPLALAGVKTVHQSHENETQTVTEKEVLSQTENSIQIEQNRNVINKQTGDNLSFIGASSRFKVTKDFEANDPQLSSSQCLKNAVGLAVDATSAVLSQTLYQIIDAEQEYLQLVTVLVTLLEYQIQVLGLEVEEQKMSDLVVEARSEMNQAHERKQELDILFSSVEKLAEATSEVAFAAGADYASVSSSERLHSALMEKKRLQQQSEAAEHKLHLMQATVIEKTMKHQESLKCKKKANQTAVSDLNQLNQINET
ncbi:diablo mitochondrial [Biomphalaria pfeifferi]|uniref:Direct IAP-binding protein with low pI n=1 Tax=Biomphalaria pfeifferi TaxID=112525 RepID=A0AAD8B7E1_BIOPF|nr:diablo mitochondrial [Biomphalaria pfeifferi]